MSDHRPSDPSEKVHTKPEKNRPAEPVERDARMKEALEIVENLGRSLEDSEPLRQQAYRLKKKLFEIEVDWNRFLQEHEKMSEVLEKVTSPALRIGTYLGKTGDGLAWVSVGGSEYCAQVDPRIEEDALQAGVRVQLNEAVSVVGVAGTDPFGPVVRIDKVLPDGRLEIGGDRSVAGGGTTIAGRSKTLEEISLASGDLVRLDSTSRLAVERLGTQEQKHLLEEVPQIRWEDVGGQARALGEIRKAVVNPILHADLYRRYRFKAPRGFLLYGPPGCGKTMIGKATAHYMAQKLGEKEGREIRGVFFHIKGPEIFNMWLGESERIVRELFEQGREAKKRGDFPVLFIDEAEAILGTRRSMRSFNIHNTLVPMFCAEMDGLGGSDGFMVILATNRPEMIDPAVLRPGRIDRKIRVVRPDRDAAAEIVPLYLSSDIPLSGEKGPVSGADRNDLMTRFLDRLYAPSEENALLEVVFRSGRRETLFRSDIASGAILASIVDRAKEKSLLRELENPGGKGEGVTESDLWQAATEEYEEGDIIPSSDAAEDWLALLDMRQRDIVDLRRFKAGERDRKTLERRTIE
jgi:proteasome-associated ATPase